MLPKNLNYLLHSNYTFIDYHKYILKSTHLLKALYRRKEYVYLLNKHLIAECIKIILLYKKWCTNLFPSHTIKFSLNKLNV